MENTPRKISGLRDYLVAGLIGASLIVFFGLYQGWRRGFFFDAPASAGAWYVPNEAVADAALLLIGFSFLIGPLTRYFDRFDRWLQYRKEIGIIGGFLAFFHGIVSLFFVPKKFSPEWLFSGDSAFTALAGYFSATCLSFLILISLKIFIERLGGKHWWFLQRWGVRLAVFLALLHVIPMKWTGWMQWLTIGSSVTREVARPGLPPLSLLAALVLGWIILIRLFETIFIFRSAGMTTREISTDPILKGRGARFMKISFGAILFILLVLLFRWGV